MADDIDDPDFDFGDDETGDNNGRQDELFEHFAVTADRGQSLLRIDKFLTHRMEHVSRARIQGAAEGGNILVNGAVVKSNYKVKPGDKIQIVMPYPRREVEIIAEDIPLTIVHEDDDVIIVDKPAGLVVHPGHGNYSGTLVNALAYHCGTHQQGDMRAGLVHRIDKNTSGLLVVAKNEPAHTKLAKQFFDHTIERRYVALVWGNFDDDEGTITGNIGRSHRDRLKMAVLADDDPAGKHAVTHWRVLKRYGYVTLVELRLETGRTHQIRVHMEHIGHPLFNDERYGGDRILKGTTFSKYKQFIENSFALMPRHALHARILGFIHPSADGVDCHPEARHEARDLRHCECQRSNLKTGTKEVPPCGEVDAGMADVVVGSPPVEGWQSKTDGVVGSPPVEGWQSKTDGVVGGGLKKNPADGWVHFESPLPADFRAVLDRWDTYISSRELIES